LFARWLCKHFHKRDKVLMHIAVTTILLETIWICLCRPERLLLDYNQLILSFFYFEFHFLVFLIKLLDQCCSLLKAKAKAEAILFRLHNVFFYCRPASPKVHMQAFSFVWIERVCAKQYAFTSTRQALEPHLSHVSLIPFWIHWSKYFHQQSANNHHQKNCWLQQAVFKMNEYLPTIQIICSKVKFNDFCEMGLAFCEMRSNVCNYGHNNETEFPKCIECKKMQQVLFLSTSNLHH